ncbi:MAG TPA: hypothetical protein VKV02_06095 [Acidobacteriaceae bacterium]|nr:hypothetical protein [Acidobacteriaceae bacterium]
MTIEEVKAYRKKIAAQLHEAKALLEGVEAHTQGKLAQSELDTISHLKSKHAEIDKKVHQDLKEDGQVAIAAKVKSDIDAELTKLKASLDHLAAKTKAQPAHK